ncbi:MAG: hypothetical protein AAF752_03540, partial [Bacteroidota bacterium]
MILHSDILPNLRKAGVSVALVVPNAEEANMQALAQRHGVSLVQAPVMHSKLRSEYEGLLRRYLFENVLENPSLRSWHYRYLDEGGKTAAKVRLYLGLNKVSLRSPAIRRMLDSVERRLFLDSPEVAQIIADLNPSVVVSTYPVAILEACFLHEARKAGCTTVSQLLSWDNITSKGRFSVNADYYVTWGPIMSEEVKAYYGVPKNRIFECGVAHFDRHITLPSEKGVRETVGRLGLDPGKPYLFFGMSSPAITPYEIEVVEWLARAVEDGVWGPDLQLVVRPHPQNVTGYTSDPTWLPRLDGLKSTRVVIDYPSLETSSLAWNMKERDLPHLVNLLAGCAICL